MSIVERFIAKWQQSEGTAGAGPVALWTRAATAVADTLPGVGGAVLCLYDRSGTRLAVGVSGVQARLAEQLEYTIGDGPGLHAQHAAEPVVAGFHFGRRWPVFHDSLVSRTPFRAVRAVPMAAVSADWYAVLLLYYAEADDVHDVDIAALADVSDVADVVSSVVMCSIGTLAAWIRLPVGSGLPHHLEQRLAVRTAIGMLVGEQQLCTDDALDVLRGHSYAHDTTLDDTVFQIVTGHLDSRTI